MNAIAGEVNCNLPMLVVAHGRLGTMRHAIGGPCASNTFGVMPDYAINLNVISIQCTGDMTKGEWQVEDRQYVRQTLLNGLYGRGSHVSPDKVFEELDWKLVGQVPAGVTHSIWQILNHMIYWQDFSLTLLRGENPDTPQHASDTWTDQVSPSSEDEWQGAVKTFFDGLCTVEECTDVELEGAVPARANRSRAEVIGMIVGHNSYHMGQVVLVRQMLGAWPPPSGGDTW